MVVIGGPQHKFHLKTKHSAHKDAHQVRYNHVDRHNRGRRRPGNILRLAVRLFVYN